MKSFEKKIKFLSGFRFYSLPIQHPGIFNQFSLFVNLSLMQEEYFNHYENN